MTDLVEVLEHVLRAFVVEALGMMCGSFFIHRARPVPFAFENFQYQVFEVLEPLAEFFAEVVEQSLVSATLPALLSCFELFWRPRHA